MKKFRYSFIQYKPLRGFYIKIFQIIRLLKRVVRIIRENIFISQLTLKKRVFNGANPSVWHKDWFSINCKKCIMICHDQKIDRRIIQQAKSLEKIGIKTLIVCLSFNENDALENQEGILIHRVGTKKIVPDCIAYWIHQRFAFVILALIFLPKKIRNGLHTLNNIFYKVLLKLVYRCATINHPLPFEECFYRAAYLYRKPCFVMGHDLPSLAAAARVADKRKSPLLYDAHELYSDQKVFSSYQKKILDKTEAFYIKKCTRVFIVCESLARVMAEKYNIKEPEVIFNAVPLHVCKNLPLKNNILPINDKFILFQGGLLRNRNLENLLKGFLMLDRSDIKMVFLGPKDKEFESYLSKIAGNKLSKNIFFVDPVEQHELLAITESAMFGVIPYLPEDLNTKYCLPNKLFEFIQAEAPFLYHSGLVEVSKIAQQLEGSAIGANLETPEGVKYGFESMLKLNLENCKNNLKDHKNNFSWEVEEEKLFSSIRSVLDLDNITHLAIVSAAPASIKDHEFSKIVQETPETFYAAAIGSEPLPQCIVFDFPSLIQLRKINITWESDINYGTTYSIEYFDDKKDDFVEVNSFNNIIGTQHFLDIRAVASKFRLMVHKVKGQQRLLMRNIKFFGHQVH